MALKDTMGMSSWNSFIPTNVQASHQKWLSGTGHYSENTNEQDPLEAYKVQQARKLATYQQLQSGNLPAGWSPKSGNIPTIDQWWNSGGRATGNNSAIDDYFAKHYNMPSYGSSFLGGLAPILGAAALPIMGAAGMLGGGAAATSAAAAPTAGLPNLGTTLEGLSGFGGGMGGGAGGFGGGWNNLAQVFQSGGTMNDAGSGSLWDFVNEGGGAGGADLDWYSEPWANPSQMGGPVNGGLGGGSMLPDWLKDWMPELNKKMVGPALINLLLKTWQSGQQNKVAEKAANLSNPLMQPQRLPFQQQYTNLMTNPGQFQNTPFAKDQLALLGQQFENTVSKYGPGGDTNFEGYIKPAQGLISSDYFNYMNQLGQAAGFNQGPGYSGTSYAGPASKAVDQMGQGFGGLGSIFDISKLMQGSGMNQANNIFQRYQQGSSGTQFGQG